jgi:hypothetical protein
LFLHGFSRVMIRGWPLSVRRVPKVPNGVSVDLTRYKTVDDMLLSYEKV